MWIEVDLHFKLNLGPIKVSGATIRGTLNEKTGRSRRRREGSTSVSLCQA